MKRFINIKCCWGLYGQKNCIAPNKSTVGSGMRCKIKLQAVNLQVINLQKVIFYDFLYLLRT